MNRLRRELAEAFLQCRCGRSYVDLNDDVQVWIDQHGKYRARLTYTPSHEAKYPTEEECVEYIIREMMNVLRRSLSIVLYWTDDMRELHDVVDEELIREILET